MTAPLYLALVHYPVRDRQGDEITTAVTNLDVHDIARSARTYGLEGYFVVTPIGAQVELVDRILEHWRDGSGAKRIPHRAEALALVRIADSVAACEAEIEKAHGKAPVRVVTAATAPEGKRIVDYPEARELRAQDERPWLLLFGTGYGLSSTLTEPAEVALAPIRPGVYNHLSVRAAVSIVLDRLVEG